MLVFFSVFASILLSVFSISVFLCVAVSLSQRVSLCSCLSLSLNVFLCVAVSLSLSACFSV